MSIPDPDKGVILSASEESRPPMPSRSCLPRPIVPLHVTGTRRLRLFAVLIPFAILLAGCAASPEAARIRGEPGADPGNRGATVEFLAPPDRFARIFAGIPYDGPSVTSPDTAQS